MDSMQSMLSLAVALTAGLICLQCGKDNGASALFSGSTQQTTTSDQVYSQYATGTAPPAPNVQEQIRAYEKMTPAQLYPQLWETVGFSEVVIDGVALEATHSQLGSPGCQKLFKDLRLSTPNLETVFGQLGVDPFGASALQLKASIIQLNKYKNLPKMSVLNVFTPMQDAATVAEGIPATAVTCEDGEQSACTMEGAMWMAVLDYMDWASNPTDRPKCGGP